MELTILESMSNILDKLKDPETVGKKEQLKFSVDRLPLIKEETDILQRRLGINPVQSVLLSVLIQKSAAMRCDMESIAEYMGMNYVKLLSYDKDIKDLIDRWIIRQKYSELRVPNEVIAQLREDKAYQKPQTSGLSTRQIASKMSVLFKMIKEGEVNFSRLMRELDEIMYNNPETSIGKTVKRYMVREGEYAYNKRERFLFFLLIHLYENRNNDMVSWSELEPYFDEYDIIDSLEELYHGEELQLQKEGLIEYTSLDGLIEKEFFHIKDSIKEELLADKGGLHKKLPFVCDIEPKDITQKELFYNASEVSQISTLEGLLTQGKLNRVYHALRDKGMRTGFTCLFYGDPGTGKTETVYQLAKKTGRKIIVADVSRLKDCYVGQTEKNVKALFYDYGRACKSEEITPILLFNEADAIFGIRKDNAQSAVDKMENSVQNIILQEMENLCGILIATTNLTGNLDKAFERRFLYKVKFSKPDLPSKEKIWKSMLPNLDEEEVRELAKEYDFSGGQIENIVRKKEIQSILLGVDPGFEQIKDYCNEEMIEKMNPFGKRIGYCIE